MRFFLLLSLWVLCSLATPAFAEVPAPYGSSQPAKVEGVALPLAPAAPGVAGEDLTNPIVISSLPYSGTGNSCTFLNSVLGTCGGTGPDVVYAFTPAQNVCVTISLCNLVTTFDTVLNLYLNSAATQVACSDDVCGVRSELSNVTLFAGNTYYIAVDGFAGECGPYQLDLTLCPPPRTVSFPVGALSEGESLCTDGSADSFNAGCNSVPPSYIDVPCLATPVTYAGHFGDFVTGGLNSRDTDWYRVRTDQPTTLVAALNSEINSVLSIVSLTAGCATPVVHCPIQFASPCTPTACSATVSAGTYLVFAAPADYTGYPCSARYTLTVSGMGCVTGVRAVSWGRLKVMYR